MDISSFYVCEGVGLRSKQHNAVFRGSVPDTSLSCTYPVKLRDGFVNNDEIWRIVLAFW